MLIKLKVTKLITYIIFFSFILFFILNNSQKSEAKIFKIANIEISEPFDSNFNKEKVINKAFSYAFNELTSTLVTSKDKEKITSTKLKDIKFLIDSFEISDENFIDKKYIAKFNVNFNKKNTLSFFEKQNIFPSSNKKKNFLTILIFIDNDTNQIYLYDNNPFYENWTKFDKNYFLINYILMEEDIDDLKVITENKENIENYKFEKIIEKYDLNDYIISIFFKTNDRFRVLSKLYFDNQVKIFNNSFQNSSITNKDYIDKIILKTKIDLEDIWKKNNQINTSIKLPINLQIKTKNLKRIIFLENQMDNIDMISNYFITSVNNEFTTYKIIFNGSPKQFLDLMYEKKINITTENEIWKVR